MNRKMLETLYDRRTFLVRRIKDAPVNFANEREVTAEAQAQAGYLSELQQLNIYIDTYWEAYGG